MSQATNELIDYLVECGLNSYQRNVIIVKVKAILKELADNVVKGVKNAN